MWWVIVVVGIMRACATSCRVVSPSLDVECLVEQPPSRRLLGSAEKPHREIMWVHTPKTGSSFCLTVAHEQCRSRWPSAALVSDVYMLRGCARIKYFQCEVHTMGHEPLRDVGLLNKFLFVAVVRQPLARVMSSFLDGNHHEGMSPGAWAALDGEMKVNADSKCARRDSACRDVALFEIYARNPDMAACQTKMIGGHACSSPVEGSINGLLEESTRRLRLFFFVGLFEDWDNMIVSFQSRLGYDKTSLSSVDFAHLRSSGKHLSIPSAILRNYTDPADEYLYASAKVLYCCRFRVEPVANIGNASSSSASDCNDVACPPTAEQPAGHQG